MRSILSKLNSTLLLALRKMSSSSSSKYKNLEIENAGKIMTIGINRPEKRNAVNPETASELFSAFNDFQNDEDSWVAVLHGTGGNFCAGYDLSSLASAPECLLQQMKESNVAPMGPSRMCFNKPVIAAIDGYAVAGGLELALLCDLRVMEESAVVGVYCRRFGVPLIDGGTVRLQKLIGLSRAMDMILTGRSITAKEAYDFGLANRVCSTGSALAVALQLAHSLLRYPQRCMNLDRQSAYYAAYNAASMEDALQYEFDNGIQVVQEESVQGAKRFQEGIGKGGSFNVKNPSNSKL
ncbi:HPCD-like protein [Mya arenaria]|uniref:HPCD-like protein n=1 Tax=Mya arenaria TaxID=6604 RepID=A0ABY7F873_MYAAR|nr:enoyl-CoA hydratase EchA19-like [Mya arenaria]WAR16969.1 HPCD-like protein [Mya arenaria]